MREQFESGFDIGELHAEIMRYEPNRRCRCSIEKWAAIRLSDPQGQLDQQCIRERVSLLATDYKQLNLAVHYEAAGYEVVYEQRLRDLRHMLETHLDDIEHLVALIKGRQTAR